MTSDTLGVEELREAVARIIDPHVWSIRPAGSDPISAHLRLRGPSLSKADAILALLPKGVDGGGREEESVSQSQPCAEAGTHIPPSPYMPSLLDRAIYIAAGAHSGQIDKAGAPYIHHVLRVMQAMESIEGRVVAVLHDVLEDCPDWSASRLLAEDIPTELVIAVQALTRHDGEGYEAFIARVAQNPLAAEVKCADLMDNMDLTRLSNPGPRDHFRVAKYERALAALSASPASPRSHDVPQDEPLPTGEAG